MKQQATQIKHYVIHIIDVVHEQQNNGVAVSIHRDFSYHLPLDNDTKRMYFQF